MPPRKKKKRRNDNRLQLPWAVRQAVAEALHPGEIDRIISMSTRLIRWAVKKYCGRWVSKIGFDDAYAEACYGAMRGVVAWLLNNGPGNDTLKVNTYIVQGIKYRFGTGFPLWIGPIKVSQRVYVKTPIRLSYYRTYGEDDDDYPFPDDGGLPRSDDDEEADFLTNRVMEIADDIDPVGDCRRLLVMRFGLSGGGSMSFSAMAEVLGVSKQAVQSRFARFMGLIQERIEVS